MTDVEALEFVLYAPDLLVARASAQRFDPHMHDTWSVIVLTKGNAMLRSRRWSAVVRAGDAVIVAPYEVHEGIGFAGAVEYWVLYPSRRRVSEHFLPGRLPLFRVGSVRAGTQTWALLDALTQGVPNAVRVEDALCDVFGSCALEGRSPDGEVAAVDEACRLIEDLDHACLRTGALADAVGLHPSHFVRTFHRTKGVAPQTYVRQVRVARAWALICSGVALAEAALVAGFCDQPHLTREFRKVYGVAPGRLSRSLRKSRSRSAYAARAG